MENVFSRKKQNNHGFTLVELVVGFALLGMLFVAGAGIITSSMKIYFQVKSTSGAEKVANIIIEKATGVIEDYRKQHITVSEDGREIRLSGADGDNIMIHAENGRFCIDYSGSGEGSQDYSWRLDDKLYNGFVISDLTFSEAGYGYADNVFVMKMVLSNSTYGDFTFERYIECFR